MEPERFISALVFTDSRWCGAVGAALDVGEVRLFTSREGPVAVLRVPSWTSIETDCEELEDFTYDELEHALVLRFRSISGPREWTPLRLLLDERRSRHLLQSLLGSGYLVIENDLGASVTFWYSPALPFTLGGRIAEALRQHRSWLVGRPPIE